MLDADTKARIDSARDILVGKVPDPKSQVEQITIALIYKFMDDMDRQSEELDGKATFFTGDFKKYRWANLLDRRLGGHERLLLYAEGIEKMNENKNIPQLFRDIFKGVFLPYRDPETLNLFLKEINGFSYEHSERLGDAYEYLLSVLGTQGDAGQFRTPRHIIDFIVAVVDPKKHETVLDPACGTAGFLISAFKRIMRNNENLTPDERARLMTNFRGYDIAPDMVRLSRANLYLHGFANPVIHEYDTLTSEERWGERCDVILANPPFMSPKGGIRPHNRFSIKAKRSEVLFVDYMAEHLNSSGRAGIIVPEGIIFQSQNAYKALRKMLVENYLWAVVSLPAGVFNPYSGVKTSILFLDRNLARRTDDLLFVKVESDGFDLGAQRRPNGKNDLPEAFEILDSYKKAQKIQEGKMALTVSRKRLLESPDINLSGDRYRKIVAVQGKWPMVRLGEVVLEIKSGFACGLSDDNSAGVPHFRPMNISTDGQLVLVGTKYISEDFFSDKSDYLLHAGDVLFNNTNSKELVGKTCLVDREIRAGYSNHLTRIRLDMLKMMPQLLALLLHEKWRKGEFLNLCNKWVGQAGVNNTLLASVEIPLPPLSIQQQIVAELDGYRKVIEGARQVIANYKPTIKIDPGWPLRPLDELCSEIRNGINVEQIDQPGKYRVSRIQTISNWIVDLEKTKWTNDEPKATDFLQEGDILLSHINSIEHLAKSAIFTGINERVVHGINLIKFRPRQEMVNPVFMHLCMLGDDFVLRARTFAQKAVNQASIKLSDLKAMTIPLPPLYVQHRIVAELEAERVLVEANRKLVEIFEAKIKSKLAEVWEGNEI